MCMCVFEFKDTFLCLFECVFFRRSTAYFHLLRSLDHQVKQVSRNAYTYDILPEFIEDFQGLRKEVSTPVS